VSAWAQLTPADNEALLSFQRSLAGAAAPGGGVAPTREQAQERGILATDTIRGNGTRAGYTLTHGGIVPNSETVTVDGSLRVRNRDYYLDLASGSIVFAEPVRTSQAIRVTYRYVPAKDGSRSALGVPSLALSFGPNTVLGLTYAQSSIKGNEAYDLITYGLSLNTKLGANSNMQNILYVSSPRDSGRVVTNVFQSEARSTSAAKEASELDTDSLILHNSTWQNGGLSLKLSYQDVGKNFAGFEVMRQQKAAPADVLKQLEKEKGIQRLSLQADYNLAAESTIGLLVNKISDEEGADIARQSLTYTDNRLKVSASFQEIDKEFKRFKDLGDKEASKWALQAGTKSSNIQLHYTGETSADVAFKKISDDGGDVSQRYFAVSSKQLKLSADFSSVDAGFRRFKGLDDPKLASQSGTERSDIRLSFTPTTGIGADIGLLRITDGNGEAVRQSLALNDKRFKFSFSTREVDKEFTHVQALGDHQWSRERGMNRTTLALSLAPFKGMDPNSAWNSFSKTVIGSETGEFNSQSLNLSTKRFTLSVTESSIDKEFGRLSDLDSTDYQKMALDVYRQFDPNAQVANISKYDLAAMVNQAGIERRNIISTFNLNNALITLQSLSIGDDTGSINRQVLTLQGRNYKITGLLQSIDEGFMRVGSLSPIEIKNFGREYGMDRIGLSSEFTLNSGVKLSASFARVSEGESDFIRSEFAFSGKNLNMTARYRDMDPEFTRILDLSDTDRKNLVYEQGMRAYDLRLMFQPAKTVSVDSFVYSGKHPTGQTFIHNFRNDIAVTSPRLPKITLFSDILSYGSVSSPDNYSHQKLTMAHKVGSISVNLLHDNVSTKISGAETTVETQAFHFETGQQGKTLLAGDWKNIEQTGGIFTDIQSLTLKTKLFKNLDFSGSRTFVRSDKGDQLTQDFSLSGKIFGSTALSLRFGEGLLDGLNMGRVRELSIIPGKPHDIGPFKNADWKFSFAESRKEGYPMDLKGSLVFQANIGDTKIGYEETTGVTQKDVTAGYEGGEKTFSKVLNIVSSTDSAKRLHYSLSYKALDAGPGDPILVRRYNADLQISEETKLTYMYSSYPEGRIASRLEPRSEEQLKLSTLLTKRLNFVGQFVQIHDYEKNMLNNQLNLGIAGNTSSLGVLEASYGYDKVITPEGETTAHTYRLKYDYQVSADQFFTFTGKYTDWSGPKPSNIIEDDLIFQLDFRTMFN
jgi:hypothetical protein